MPWDTHFAVDVLGSRRALRFVCIRGLAIQSGEGMRDTLIFIIEFASIALRLFFVKCREALRVREDIFSFCRESNLHVLCFNKADATDFS